MSDAGVTNHSVMSMTQISRKVGWSGSAGDNFNVDIGDVTHILAIDGVGGGEGRRRRSQWQGDGRRWQQMRFWTGVNEVVEDAENSIEEERMVTEGRGGENCQQR